MNKMNRLHSRVWALLIVGALACAFSSAVSSATSDSVDLRSLCANKAIDLTRISQIKLLVGDLDTQAGSECPERVRSALTDLDDLINSINGNVCSMNAVDRIRSYYDAYISSSVDSGNKNEESLPAPLKNFVLAFGLQVSKLCKKNMINSLIIDSQTLLKEKDHQLIAPWTNEQSVISQLMNEPSDYDDLLLPRDLNRIMEDADTDNREQHTEHDDDKMYMQTATGNVIRKMQAICSRRFRPIYEQLILPLIYLSNIGFNYQGEELERELQEIKFNKDIHQWYRIIYLCEPLQDLEIVEDPKDAEVTQGTDQKLVRILNKDEAAKIKAEFESSHEGVAEGLQLKGIEQIVYQQEYGTAVEDEVMDLQDKSLAKMVQKFATHKSELQRIRTKVMRKLAKFVMNKLKHGQLNIIGTLMGSKKDEASRHEVHSINNEIVQSLDEYVQQASTPDGAVSGGLNGLGGLGKRYYYKASTQGLRGMSSAVAQKAKDGYGKSIAPRHFWYAVATIIFITGVVVIVCSVVG